MENLELELKLTLTHVNTIIKHLAAGTYAEVSELIAMLHGQSLPQIQAAAPAVPAPSETPAATEEPSNN